MAVKELREIYGNTKAWQALNRAIRAEIPGGGDVLDALTLAGALRSTPKGDELFSRLLAARNEMQAAIARKYGFKSTLEAENDGNR